MEEQSVGGGEAEHNHVVRKQTQSESNRMRIRFSVQESATHESP